MNLQTFNGRFGPRGEDSDELQLNERGGLYCVTNEKYPGWVKIGSAQSNLYSRVSGYGTYAPHRSEWVVHALAIKARNSTTHTASHAEAPKNFILMAELRLIKALQARAIELGDEVRAKREWFKVDVATAVAIMRKLHAGGRDPPPPEQADGSSYKFILFKASGAVIVTRKNAGRNIPITLQPKSPLRQTVRLARTKSFQGLSIGQQLAHDVAGVRGGLKAAIAESLSAVSKPIHRIAERSRRKPLGRTTSLNTRATRFVPPI